MHAIEITFHVRLDERIYQGRDCAFVLAIFRQHYAGQRQRAVGMLLCEYLRNSPLVGGIGIGVHEADADRTHTVAAEEMRSRPRARFVQRPDLLTAKVQPPSDFSHQMERHNALRLHPEIGVAVAFGHRLTGDLQEMAEARGDNEAKPADWTLQQRVCGDGGAVGEARDLGRRLSRRLEDLAHAANEADGRIGWRARNLGDAHGARAAVDADDVGEGAAGIDADAQTRLVRRR